MKKVNARACSNIALVKYWGKRDKLLNLPAVASISITLDALYTESTLWFDENLISDKLILNGGSASEKDTNRLSGFLDLVRKKAKMEKYAYVESENNFPTSAGLASSASSYASLALAGSRAAGLNLTPTELSELARRGSGSAARSIYGGFVEMKSGVKKDGSDAVAEQLFPKEHWDLNVLIAITSEEKKKIGSTDGMEASRLTSPYYQSWIDSSNIDIIEMREAISHKDFQKVAEVAEFSCLKMHALAMATNPGLIYWNGTTVQLIHTVRSMRDKGIPVFFTIDAGPQVKAICPAEYTDKIMLVLSEKPGVSRVLKTQLGDDARVLGGTN